MLSGMQIRTKLAFVMTLLLAIVSIAIYLYFPEKQQKQAVAALIEQATAVADTTAFSVAAELDQRDPIAVTEGLTGLRRNPDLVYFILRDASGKIVTSFNDSIAAETRVMPRAARRSAPVGTIGTPGETTGGFSADEKLYQTTTVVRHRGKDAGTLVIGFSLDRALLDAERSRATVAFVTVLAFGIGVALIFLLSRFITGPLERMVRVTERIAEGEMSIRSDVDAQDEVGQLARSFNKMLDRLDATRGELEELNRTLENRVEERAKDLRRTEERYRLLFDRNLAGVYIALVDGRVVACNDAFARMFGFASNEQFLAERGTIPYADSSHRDRILKTLLTTGTVTNEEAELRGREGQSVWALESVRLVRSETGASTLEGFLLDVTARKRAEQEITYKAYHDLLTNLPNRTMFVDRLEAAIGRANESQRSVAVLFFDLDDLKAINDTLGHALGDTILKMVGRRLALTLRQFDVVARIGGDEFLVLLPDVANAAAAEEIAQKHLAAIRNPFLIDDDELYVTSSVGVALYPDDGIDAEALIRNADAAMYRAKAEGGNRVEVCTGIAEAPALARSHLVQELRQAIERDEFVVLYQPQVNILDRRIVGVEALVRWEHPERGSVQPAGFIGAAEQSGLITALGEVVLRKACARAAAWRQMGFVPPRLSVNVSPRQLYQRNFVGMIERALADTGFDGAFLELELTESVTVNRSDRVIRMLRRLRDRGISIAVDDFGTGQSSLSYLKEFPVDTVKIDRSYIVDLVHRASDQSIVRAMLLVANQLGLRTIAEGVENEEQCKFLRENGCAEMQGFMVSRPVTASELEQKYLEWAPQRSAKAPSEPRVLERRISPPRDPA